MSRNYSLNAEAAPGSQIWNYLADVSQIAPNLNARPAWIRFRVANLGTGAAPVSSSCQDPTNPRINPDFDFYWLNTTTFLEMLPGDVGTMLSHLAYFQIQGNANLTAFDRPQPFSFYGNPGLGATGGGVNAPYFQPNTLSLIENKVPYLFQAGESLTTTFSCDPTFPAAAHVAEVCLGGIYVAKNLNIKQVMQPVELVVRMGKSLRKFLELAQYKITNPQK